MIGFKAAGRDRSLEEKKNFRLASGGFTHYNYLVEKKSLEGEGEKEETFFAKMGSLQGEKS